MISLCWKWRGVAVSFNGGVKGSILGVGSFTFRNRRVLGTFEIEGFVKGSLSDPLRNPFINRRA